MEIETGSRPSSRVIDSEVGGALQHHLPRPAFGSVLQDTIATENAQVLHGWLVDGRRSDPRSRAGDHA